MNEITRITWYGGTPSLSPSLQVSDTRDEIWEVLDVCRMCGAPCIWNLCDSCNKDFERGWYPDYFNAWKAQQKIFFDYPRKLSQKYETSHDVLGKEQLEVAEVYQLWYELYDNFCVAIIQIKHQEPWVHQWRKLWPEWKRDGQRTYTPKISNKTREYRVAFDPNNKTESEMVVYSGKMRNGNLIPDHEINYSSLLGIIHAVDLSENKH